MMLDLSNRWAGKIRLQLFHSFFIRWQCLCSVRSSDPSAVSSLADSNVLSKSRFFFSNSIFIKEFQLHSVIFKNSVSVTSSKNVLSSVNQLFIAKKIMTCLFDIEGFRWHDTRTRWHYGSFRLPILNGNFR